MVEIQGYPLREGEEIKPGAPIVKIENYWAEMQLNVNGSGIVKKVLFDRGTTVKIGDPIAIIEADGEAVPYGRSQVTLEIVKKKREKPAS